MKTNLRLHGFILLLAGAPFALATPAPRGASAAAGAQCDSSCRGTGQGGNAASCPETGEVARGDTTPLVLGASARDALLFQIDEERMARELYQAFGAQWGLPPFAAIPAAEIRHESALRQLATRAGLNQPTGAVGRFDSAEVQKRYDDLLALGLVSADSALRAAALVEEVDIADLNTLRTTADLAALREVADALKTASGHHLQAFVRQLAARGITYAPQVLSAEEYQAMLAGGGRGMGRGQGRGRGPGRA